MSLSTDGGQIDEGDGQESQDEQFPIERSGLYQRWRAEQEQIMVLKWIESEKVSHDIGYHRAVWIWNTGPRREWINKMRASGVAGF